MSYLVGRVFLDAAGYRYVEHRPGWIRRVGAPENQFTEHAVETDMLGYMTEHGILIIEEEP